MSKFDDVLNEYMKHAGDGINFTTETFDNFIGLVVAVVLFPFWCLGKLGGGDR